MHTSLRIPPTNADAEPDTLGTIQHAISTVQLSYPATLRNRQLFELFALPVVGTHGQYHQLGLYQTAAQLAATQRDTLATVLRDEQDTEAAMTKFATAAVALQSLQDTCGPAVQSLVQGLANAVISEAGYIDEIVSKYEIGDNSGPPLSAEECRARVENLDKCLETTPVVEQLRDLIKQYNRRIAEIVVKGILDIPLPLGTDTETPLDTKHLQTVSLEAHFQRVAEQIRDTIPAANAAEETVLATVDQAIETNGDIPTFMNKRGNDEHCGVDVPLVTVPNTWEARSRRPTEGVDPAVQISFGSLVERLFRVGGIGAITYQLEDGRPNWLVNPWIADSRLSGNDRSYTEAWQSGFFFQRIATQLLARAKEGFPVSPLTCPLCEISQGVCGESTCQWQPTLGALNRQLHELVRHVQQAF